MPTPNWKRNRSRHELTDTHSSDASNSDVMVSIHVLKMFLRTELNIELRVWMFYLCLQYTVPHFRTPFYPKLHSSLSEETGGTIITFSSVSIKVTPQKGAQSKWDRWVIRRMRTMLLPNTILVIQTCLQSPIPLSHKGRVNGRIVFRI